MLARTQPARSTTPDRSTTPGSSRAERGRQRRHDPGHRLGVDRLGGTQLRRRRGRPGADEPADRDPLDLRPVDQAATGGTLGTPADDGRRGAERRPDEEAGLPDPVVAPRRAAVRPARALGSSRLDPELDLLDVREGGPEQPAGQRVEAGRVAGRQLEVDGGVAGPSGASRPLTLSSSARAEAVAVAESTIATRSPTCAAMSERSSG